MKITVIGAGNMGGAIVRGLIREEKIEAADITVVDTNADTLARFKELGVQTTELAADGAKGAEVILLAVKPWLVRRVTEQIAPHTTGNTLVGSVAAGVDFDKLGRYFECDVPLFRIIPNTAVSVGQSMTFITSLAATPEQRQTMISLFEPLGKVMEVPEKQMAACMALGSCGIAFAMRYIRASMQAAVELGIPPEMARRIVTQTVRGAAELLIQGNEHPEVEIDKVTTPGGFTILGLNVMEEFGFSNAVIQGIRAAR